MSEKGKNELEADLFDIPINYLVVNLSDIPINEDNIARKAKEQLERHNLILKYKTSKDFEQIESKIVHLEKEKIYDCNTIEDYIKKSKEIDILSNGENKYYVIFFVNKHPTSYGYSSLPFTSGKEKIGLRRGDIPAGR
ncbi:MAG: hypothetical protein RMI79_04335 [Nitrososphaerota archaeon]|nr:hypothetical protein [Nitrososphaerota archaeon]